MDPKLFELDLTSIDICSQMRYVEAVVSAGVVLEPLPEDISDKTVQELLSVYRQSNSEAGAEDYFDQMRDRVGTSLSTIYKCSPVARQGNGMVGFLLLEPWPDDLACAKLLAVRADHQRRGIGTALLVESARLAKQYGRTRLRAQIAGTGMAERILPKLGYQSIPVGSPWPHIQTSALGWDR